MGSLFKPKTATTSTTAPLGALPVQLRKGAMELVPQLEGQLKAAGLNTPGLLQGAQGEILRTLGGEGFDPKSNAALNRAIEFLRAEAERGGAREQALLRERFGRLGPSFSLDEAKAAMELERDLQNRLQGQTSQMLASLYEPERARQFGSAGAASQLALLPTTAQQNLLRTIASLAGGQQTSAAPSKFEQVTGLVAALTGSKK